MTPAEDYNMLAGKVRELEAANEQLQASDTERQARVFERWGGYADIAWLFARLRRLEAQLGDLRHKLAHAEAANAELRDAWSEEAKALCKMHETELDRLRAENGRLCAICQDNVAYIEGLDAEIEKLEAANAELLDAWSEEAKALCKMHEPELDRLRAENARLCAICQDWLERWWFEPFDRAITEPQEGGV